MRGGRGGLLARAWGAFHVEYYFVRTWLGFFSASFFHHLPSSSSSPRPLSSSQPISKQTTSSTTSSSTKPSRVPRRAKASNPDRCGNRGRRRRRRRKNFGASPLPPPSFRVAICVISTDPLSPSPLVSLFASVASQIGLWYVAKAGEIG